MQKHKRSNRHNHATRVIAYDPPENHEPNTQQPLRAAPRHQPIAFRNGFYIYAAERTPSVLTRREHRRATYLQMLIDDFTCQEAEAIDYWTNLPVV